MFAAVMRSYGDVETLSLEELPDPVAAAGEVVVDVAAAAVNFPDVLVMANKYQVSVPLPFVPGSELAGTVREVGPGVTTVAPGDRVSATALRGAFAEQVALPAANLVPVPDGLDFISAAALHVTYLTAYNSLVQVARCRRGEWVVVLGAAGGVGLASIDVATRLGCRTLAVVSSASKAEACRRRGADATLTYDAGDLKDGIRAATSGGGHVVIDPVGGSYAEAALRAMRRGGRYVTVGFASGEIPRLPMNLVLLKWLTILGFDLHTYADHDPAAARDGAAGLMDMVAGGLRPHVSAVVPLAEVKNALRLVSERRSTGKVVVAMQPGSRPRGV